MTLKREKKKIKIRKVIKENFCHSNDFAFDFMLFLFSLPLSTYLFEGEGGTKNNNPVKQLLIKTEPMFISCETSPNFHTLGCGPCLKYMHKRT